MRIALTYNLRVTDSEEEAELGPNSATVIEVLADFA